MKAHDRLTAAINAAADAGRPALIPFITAGYPEPRDFVASLKKVASVGDVVELGIPFSDPMADGMTIQRSSFVALQKGVSLKWIFDQLDSIAGEVQSPLVMMSYLNPLLAFGMRDRGHTDSTRNRACLCISTRVREEKSGQTHSDRKFGPR